MNNFVLAAIAAFLVLLPAGVSRADCSKMTFDKIDASPQLNVNAEAGHSGAVVPLLAGKAKCLELSKDGKLKLDIDCVGKWLAEKPSDVSVHGYFLEKTLDADLGSQFVPGGGCAQNGKVKFVVAVKTELFAEDSVEHEGEKLCTPGTLLYANDGEALEPSNKATPEAKNAATMLLKTSEGTLKRIKKLTATVACTAAPAADAASVAQTNVTYAEPTAWCGAGRAEDHEVVCVLITPNERRTTRVPARSVLEPNRGLTVYVGHEPGASVTGTLGGTRGLTDPGISTPGKAYADTDPGAEPPPPKRVTLAVSVLTFSPRQPGAADLRVEVKPIGATTAKTQDVPLEVETTYWGAVRFGFAGVFGDAVTKGYEVRKFAGSEQAEIAVKSDPKLNFEVVLGFSPYLFDLLICPGGRSRTGGCNVHVAPYFAFGLLGQGASGVESFSSLHAGLEVEVTGTFSVAGTVVLRKVTELSKGYAVGSPVEVDTHYTTESTGIGGALVLNVSPDFLQFGVPAAADKEEAGEQSGASPAPGGEQ